MEMRAGCTAAVGLVLFFLGLWQITRPFRPADLQIRLEGCQNWWRGALVGTVLTAVSQSSSAVTVLLMAAVSARQLSLRAAFGILLGANIGTTATAWLAQLGQLPGAVGLVLPALLCLLLIWQTRRCRAALGLALLLFGMHTMTTGAQALLQGQGTELLQQALQTPWRGGLWGAGVTAVLQSSSVTVGMLQAAVSSGALSMAAAAPVVAGNNLGTCVTALLAAIPAARGGRQLAGLHLLFNLFAAAVLTALWSLGLGQWLGRIPATSTGVAAFHTLFNLLPALGLLCAQSAVAFCRARRYDRGNLHQRQKERVL